MPYTIPNLADAAFPAQAAPDSGDLAILASAFGRTGVITGCGVTAQGSPNMTVAVAAGVVQIGGFTTLVSASATLTITTADATNPRIDLVYTLAAGTPTVAAGTAAASPVYPAIPANSVIFAAVYVPAADTTIAANQITDKRVQLDLNPAWSVFGGTAGSTAAASANVTAWNAAVSGVPAVGGTIFIRAGTYYFNGNTALARSRVTVIAEQGACFKQVPGSNFSTLTLGNLGGTACTDITVTGLEVDGSVVLQDIENVPTTNDSTKARLLVNAALTSFTNTTNATLTVTGAGWTTNQWAGFIVSLPNNGGALVIASNTATVLTMTGVFPIAPSNGDPFVIATGAFARALTSATNTTNAVLTMSGTTWGTTRYVGMYVNFLNGPAAGVSKLITAHTNTTVTLSGTYASPPVVTNLFQISTMPLWTSSGWEAAFGACGIVARDVYRLNISQCYIHDVFNAGVELNRCGRATVEDNDIDNFGLQFIAGPGNGISCLGPSDNPILTPSRQIHITNNRISRVGDVGIDIHGSGTYIPVCDGNTIWAQAVSAGGAATHAGVMVEIEVADTASNIGTLVSNNNVDGLSIGLIIGNSGNSSVYFAGIAVTGNMVTNTDVACSIEGSNVNISGNTFFLVGCGITSNNAIVAGFGIERDWNIAANTILLDPTRQTFGNSAIFLRWQALTSAANLASGAVTAATNASPIVLTVPSWTTTPVVGNVITVTNIIGNTAANGSWIVQAVDATHVTLQGSTGNGAFSTSASSTVLPTGHLLDSVSVTNNVLQGMGAGVTSGTHNGVYIEAMTNGAQNSAINHIDINNNKIHGFNQGISITSGAANALVNQVDIRQNKIWNNNAFGVVLSGTQIRGTVIENNTFSNNVSGSISGNTPGFTGNTDVIRNNRGINPVGNLSLPRGSIVATPITTTVYTNDTNYDCTVYVRGTITAVTVAGTVTNVSIAAAGSAVPIPLMVGHTLALTGTSLTWIWIAN